MDEHFVQSRVRGGHFVGHGMAGETDRNDGTDALPIEGMAKLSPRQLQALKSRWLTTVEALVGAAATEEGRAGLCSALGIEADQLNDVLHDARDALGQERYMELLAPKPGGPTGAILDDGQQQPADGPATGDGGT